MSPFTLDMMGMVDGHLGVGDGVNSVGCPNAVCEGAYLIEVAHKPCAAMSQWTTAKCAVAVEQGAGVGPTRVHRRYDDERNASCRARMGCGDYRSHSWRSDEYVMCGRQTGSSLALCWFCQWRLGECAILIPLPRRRRHRGCAETSISLNQTQQVSI